MSYNVYKLYNTLIIILIYILFKCQETVSLETRGKQANKCLFRTLIHMHVAAIYGISYGHNNYFVPIVTTFSDKKNRIEN